MSKNLMLKTYENITQVDRSNGQSRHVIRGFHFVLNEQCDNDYYKEVLPTIPAGTELIADFACDAGMYAMCEVDGAVHKIKIKLQDLHKVNFGDFDARNIDRAIAACDEQVAA